MKTWKNYVKVGIRTRVNFIYLPENTASIFHTCDAAILIIPHIKDEYHIKTQVSIKSIGIEETNQGMFN